VVFRHTVADAGVDRKKWGLEDVRGWCGFNRVGTQWPGGFS